MKFLMNRSYGGWGLYDERFVEWCKKNAPEFIIEDEDVPGDFHFNYDILDTPERDFWFRTHPKMIAFVESEENRKTELRSVRVIDVPDDVSPDKYYIDNLDGLETLHENHRGW